MQCANNLKQLALAVHNHVDKDRHAPPGTLGDVALPATERMSFYAKLAPLLEIDDLPELDRQSSAAAAALLVEPKPTYRVFRCRDWEREFVPAPRHATAYIGPAGIGIDAPTRPIDDPAAGFWGFDRATSFGDVKDGLSNTLLFIESARDNGAWYQGGPATVRGLDPGETPYLGTGCQFAGTHFSENWIFIRGRAYGMNVAMADGSARVIRHTIDPRVLESLLTIAGGDRVEGDW